MAIVDVAMLQVNRLAVFALNIDLLSIFKRNGMKYTNCLSNIFILSINSLFISLLWLSWARLCSATECSRTHTLTKCHIRAVWNVLVLSLCSNWLLWNRIRCLFNIHTWNVVRPHLTRSRAPVKSLALQAPNPKMRSNARWLSSFVYFIL